MCDPEIPDDLKTNYQEFIENTRAMRHDPDKGMAIGLEVTDGFVAVMFDKTTRCFILDADRALNLGLAMVEAAKQAKKLDSLVRSTETRH